jgi:hypothetical protein
VKPHASSESYAPVSRGLRKHLSEMTGNAVKLYLELLLSAAFTGPNKGQVAATFAELALRLKMHKQTVHRAARKLRPYSIQWEAAKNQHDVTVFTIQRYKSIKDFAVSRTAHSEVTAENLPDEKIDQQGDRALTAPSAIDSKGNDLSVPKKLKKLKKLEKEAAAATLPKKEDSVWVYLEIEPCGPPSFRSLLESRWASRNGNRPSVLIGETVDAWECAEGAKLRRAPKLFSALAELRNNERRATDRSAEPVEPIHVLTSAEIPE